MYFTAMVIYDIASLKYLSSLLVHTVPFKQKRHCFSKMNPTIPVKLKDVTLSDQQLTAILYHLIFFSEFSSDLLKCGIVVYTKE